MNELKGLSQQEVQERIEQGQVNYTGQSISKTKKEIVKQHTLTYFNFLNIFLAVLIVISGQLQNLTFIGVMVANTILGIIQEFKVKKTIDRLSVVTVEKVKTREFDSCLHFFTNQIAQNVDYINAFEFFLLSNL